MRPANALVYCVCGLEKNFLAQFSRAVFKPEISDYPDRCKADKIRRCADESAAVYLTFESFLVSLAVEMSVNADINAAFSHHFRELGKVLLCGYRRIVDHQNVLFRMLGISLF